MDCTGAEILKALLYHLKFSDYLPEMLRAFRERPQVLPEGYTNLALIGQFVEIPECVVLTVD